ncbi:MAG: GNAT family N-acetyltransferase [Candidatus Dormibacteraeota bacterium]|nr:GNAT family N-acetyltransferase [Candidatus Dormibacteraeota bacterium]
MKSEVEAVAGPTIVVRSIHPSDQLGLRAFHHRLSDDTVRNRYFGSHPVLSVSEALRLTTLTPGSETALVATAGERIVGVGRSIRLGEGDAAEVAFVVADGYQHNGIGTELLTLLARLGWGDGIRRFVADTFATNTAMLYVFRHSPGAVTVLTTERDGSVVHLVMAITPPTAMLAAG